MNMNRFRAGKAARVTGAHPGHAYANAIELEKR